MNKRFGKRIFFGIFIPLSSNIPLLIYGLYTLNLSGGIFSHPVILGILLTIIFGLWLYINILPYRDKNSPGNVYYQSYASAMKSCLSDPLLWLPYCLIKPLEGENDGLVSTVSAQWGEFQGVFKTKGRRGISHGDMIDLKREDYKGFDVVECYVQMVAGLAAKGF